MRLKCHIKEKPVIDNAFIFDTVYDIYDCLKEIKREIKKTNELLSEQKIANMEVLTIKDIPEKSVKEICEVVNKKLSESLKGQGIGRYIHFKE